MTTAPLAGTHGERNSSSLPLAKKEVQEEVQEEEEEEEEGD